VSCSVSIWWLTQATQDGLHMDKKAKLPFCFMLGWPASTRTDVEGFYRDYQTLSSFWLDSLERALSLCPILELANRAYHNSRNLSYDLRYVYAYMPTSYFLPHGSKMMRKSNDYHRPVLNTQCGLSWRPSDTNDLPIYLLISPTLASWHRCWLGAMQFNQ